MRKSGTVEIVAMTSTDVPHVIRWLPNIIIALLGRGQRNRDAS